MLARYILSLRMMETEAVVPDFVRDQFLVCFQVSMVRGGEGHDVNPFLNAPRPLNELFITEIK